jgi:hypothetical protein
MPRPSRNLQPIADTAKYRNKVAALFREIGESFVGTAENIKASPVGIPRFLRSSKINIGFLSPEELSCLIGERMIVSHATGS